MASSTVTGSWAPPRRATCSFAGGRRPLGRITRELHRREGVITHGKRSLRFGEVAEDAIKLTPAASVALKAAKDWKLIGQPVKRLDSPEKVNGSAKFGMDVAFPGLRTALVARPPAFGARLVRFDGAAALQVPGVEQVVPTGNGVAVVAAHFWAAKVGRDALLVDWSRAAGRRAVHRSPDGGAAPAVGGEAGDSRAGGRPGRRSDDWSPIRPRG